MAQTIREFREGKEDIVIRGVESVHIERVDKGHWFVSVQGLDGRADKFHLSCPNPSKHSLKLEHEEQD